MVLMLLLILFRIIYYFYSQIVTLNGCLSNVLLLKEVTITNYETILKLSFLRVKVVVNKLREEGSVPSVQDNLTS